MLLHVLQGQGSHHVCTVPSQQRVQEQAKRSSMQAPAAPAVAALADGAAPSATGGVESAPPSQKKARQDKTGHEGGGSK